MWVWNSNTLATWCKELTHLKRPWCWERLKVGGEVDDRGWDGWMASPTQWTWVWVNSRSWWWTGRPGVLWFMGSQRARHDWAIELNWTDVGLSFLGTRHVNSGMCSYACTYTHVYTCIHQRISPFNLHLLNLPLTFDTTEATEHEHMQEMHDRLITKS